MHKAPLLILLAACAAPDAPERVEPTFIEVSVDAPQGSVDEPVPFTAEVTQATITVRTLDINADPYPFDGDLKLRVRPGRMDQDPWIQVRDGEYTGSVSWKAAFGPTRFWASDEGDKDITSERPPSFATGVSEAVFYAFPTISEMQGTDDPETNQLDGEHAEIRVEDREVVVTALATNGFWAADLLDAPGNFSGLFVYTFSKPDGVEVGSRLALLTGGNAEYLASTQLSFPFYAADGGELHTPPAPVEIEQSFCTDDLAMEALEGSLVQVSGSTVPADFTSGSEDYEDYLEYGQWPVSLGECAVYVTSSLTVPDFNPTDFAGAELTLARGMLTQIWGQWVITIKDSEELQVVGFSGSDAAARKTSGRPPARKRPSAPGHH